MGTAKVSTLPSREVAIRVAPVALQIRVLVESSGSLTKAAKSMVAVSPGAKAVSGRAPSTGDWLTRNMVRRNESVPWPPSGSIAVKTRSRAPEKVGAGVNKALPSVIWMAINESAAADQDSSVISWS